MDLQDASARTAGRTHRDRVEDCLERIATKDGPLRAVITAMDEQARAAADRCDEATARGEWLGLLHGMPIALKDNIDTAGVRTTSGSDFFSDRVPAEDAPVVERLKKAGAIIVAKTNLAEFAFGATSQNPHHGLCRNVWDTDRIPGGSSGGSAVAVGAGMAVGALGTDTGGSVRVPASLNGVTGIRPTTGRVSNRAVTKVSLAFDTVGPMARRAVDVARQLAAMEGYDRLDASSVNRAGDDILGQLDRGLEGVRVGVPTTFFFDDVEPSMAEAIRSAIRVLEEQGATIVDVAVPGAEDAQHQMTKMLYPDAAAFHQERMRTSPERFGEDVLRRLKIGLDTTALEYAEAMVWRQQWRRTVDLAFDDVDLIVTPTVPGPPPPAEGAEMIATTKMLTSLTYAWAMADIPAVSVPCGFDRLGLPVGLQIAGPSGADGRALGAAAAYQRVTDFHLSEPQR